MRRVLLGRGCVVPKVPQPGRHRATGVRGGEGDRQGGVAGSYVSREVDHGCFGRILNDEERPLCNHTGRRAFRALDGNDIPRTIQVEVLEDIAGIDGNLRVTALAGHLLSLPDIVPNLNAVYKQITFARLSNILRCSPRDEGGKQGFFGILHLDGHTGKFLVRGCLFLGSTIPRWVRSEQVKALVDEDLFAGFQRIFIHDCEG